MEFNRIIKLLRKERGITQKHKQQLNIFAGMGQLVENS